MKALVNCDIYTGTEVLFDHALVMEGSRILDVIEYSNVSPQHEVINLGGRSIAPGFVDLQVNGGGGILFNDHPTPEALQTIALAHLRYGVTKILPTIITAPRETMREAGSAIRRAIKQGNQSILGIHYEGPFLEKGKAGVHNKAYMRQANEADLALLAEFTDLRRLITVAPEAISIDQVKDVLASQARMSIGHSNSSSEIVSNYFDAGVACVTHVHNAMSPLASREPGIVGASMANDKVWAGIIVDGLHVHFQTVRATWNAWKGKDRARLFLVSDAMPPVGSDITNFVLDDLQISVLNGKCQTSDGTLAGSALNLAQAVRNCVQKAGIPKDEALRMASTYPAEFMGVDNEIGHLRPGYAADIVIFDNEIVVSDIIQGGNFCKAH